MKENKQKEINVLENKMAMLSKEDLMRVDGGEVSSEDWKNCIKELLAYLANRK